MRRKPDELPARSQHPVAGHDDRNRIPPQRLAHGARGRRIAELLRELAVSDRPAHRNRPRELEHLAVERRDILDVERDVGQVHPLASQQRRHPFDRAECLAMRRGLARIGPAPLQPRTRRVVARLGELHADDSALGPRDAAPAERGVEQRQTLRHGTHETRGARYLSPSPAAQSTIKVNTGGSPRLQATNLDASGVTASERDAWLNGGFATTMRGFESAAPSPSGAVTAMIAPSGAR